jgi:hypothetical protein
MASAPLTGTNVQPTTALAAYKKPWRPGSELSRMAVPQLAKKSAAPTRVSGPEATCVPPHVQRKRGNQIPRPKQIAPTDMTRAPMTSIFIPPMQCGPIAATTRKRSKLPSPFRPQRLALSSRSCAGQKSYHATNSAGWPGLLVVPAARQQEAAQTTRSLQTWFDVRAAASCRFATRTTSSPGHPLKAAQSSQDTATATGRPSW